MPTLAGLHTAEQDRWFFRERVFGICEVGCAQRRGVGGGLFRLAQNSSQQLQLWTFQGNAPARRFYEARGFALVGETDGSVNEESEPDALYRWTRA